MATTNRVTPRLTRIKDQLVLRKDDLQIASKAIYDELGESLSEELGTRGTETIKRECETLRLEMSALVGELVEKALSKRRDELAHRLEQHFHLLENAIQEKWSKLTDPLEHRLRRVELVLQELRSSVSQHAESLVQHTEESRELGKLIDLARVEVKNDLLTMVKALPQPQFIVPVEAIRVEVEVPPTHVQVPELRQPEFVIHVPEQKPPEVIVQVPQQERSIVNVQVPEQKPPEVVVHVPEQKTPEVVVKVPPPRLTRKTFSYDEYNRPLSVVEAEVESKE